MPGQLGKGHVCRFSFLHRSRPTREKRESTKPFCMYLLNSRRQETDTDAADIYTFRREDGEWYIDLPAYLEQGWTKKDLQLVEGAHKFLNRISNGAQKLRLCLQTVPMEGAGVLELVELCEAPRGGAIYRYRKAKEQTGSDLFWICDLALFVFGDLPEHIYVQRLPGKDKQRTEPKNGAQLYREQQTIHRFFHYSASFHHQIK